MCLCVCLYSTGWEEGRGERWEAWHNIDLPAVMTGGGGGGGVHSYWFLSVFRQGKACQSCVMTS